MSDNFGEDDYGVEDFVAKATPPQDQKKTQGKMSSPREKPQQIIKEMDDEYGLEIQKDFGSKDGALYSKHAKG